MNNFFIHIYFSWDIYFMASPTTLFCFYFKTAEKMSWKAKNWITQDLTCEYNSGRPNIYLPKTVGLLTYCFLLTYFFLLTFYMKQPYMCTEIFMEYGHKKCTQKLLSMMDKINVHRKKMVTDMMILRQDDVYLFIIIT